MDVWRLHVVSRSLIRSLIWSLIWSLIDSYEVTVRSSDLMSCEDDDKVCVTDVRDCGPGPAAALQKSLNMSCFYHLSSSVTCELSRQWDDHIEPDVSLIFSSDDNIIWCQAVFNPASILNVTARIRTYVMRTEIRSKPVTMYLYNAVRPPQPVLTVLSSTVDSVVLSWTSSSDGSCRLRHRGDDAQTWTQSPDVVDVTLNQTLVRTITDLQPFTVYRAAVSCRETVGTWSRWSADVAVRTLETVPSGRPQVCHRVEKRDSGGFVHLHLMWKPLDFRESGGRVLGYQVSYDDEATGERRRTNVTDVMALLVVEEGNRSVDVAAFNAAGYGPATQLNVDTLTHDETPSVTNLWVSSSSQVLQVQWKSPPVGHFVVRWRPETGPSGAGWSTVGGSTTSTVIRGDELNPDVSYLISVSSVSEQRCGRPRSLPVSLRRGALMEPVRLKVAHVTKSQVTVEWAWQEKSGPIRVDLYQMVLMKSEEKPVFLWPDQLQHTFRHLTPDTEYSLLLFADNVSRNEVRFRTYFDEVPVVAAATPLLLIGVTVVIICILSRTVYKSYFFPHISSPEASAAGRWLMDPNRQKSADRKILDIKDFQVTDVLGDKRIIVVETKLDQVDALLLPRHDVIVKLSTLKLDMEYISDTPSSPLTGPDYIHHPDGDERADADKPSCWFPPRKEANGKLDVDLAQVAVNTDSYQMTCEAEYVVNTFFWGNTDDVSNGCVTTKSYGKDLDHDHSVDVSC